MKARQIILISFLFYSCSTQTKKLEDKKQTLELHYISWACACANWATSNDIQKYQDTGNLSEHCVFIEPANPNLKLSDTIGYSGDALEFTGNFYIAKGFPFDYVENEEPVDKARVFKYTSFKILKSNYQETQRRLKDKNDTARFNIDKGNILNKTSTILVNFGAIECTCPQWFETKNGDDTINGRQHFYLEQGKEGILDADTLYNGSNFPIQLKLTGQFYNKVGYPKNYKPIKGDPKPARVFRYEKIKVIRKG